VTTYVIAEKNERFVSEFWGQTFSLEDARTKAREFATRENRAVYIWNTESLEANKRPIEMVRPLRPGYSCDIYVNHAMRKAYVLAIIGNEALIEYSMPAGTTALKIAEIRNGEINGGKTIPYKNLPLRWLKAIVDSGQSWEGNPQGKNGEKFIVMPSAEEMLSAKTLAVQA
jgi:hypothetical protein